MFGKKPLMTRRQRLQLFAADVARYLRSKIPTRWGDPPREIP